MVKQNTPPQGGGSSGFIDKMKGNKNTLAIVAVIIVIAFVVAFSS